MKFELNRHVPPNNTQGEQKNRGKMALCVPYYRVYLLPEKRVAAMQWLVEHKKPFYMESRGDDTKFVKPGIFVSSIKLAAQLEAMFNLVRSDS